MKNSCFFTFLFHLYTIAQAVPAPGNSFLFQNAQSLPALHIPGKSFLFHVTFPDLSQLDVALLSSAISQHLIVNSPCCPSQPWHQSCLCGGHIPSTKLIFLTRNFLGISHQIQYVATAQSTLCNYSFIQDMFNEHLLCARHSGRCHGYRHE